MASTPPIPAYRNQLGFAFTNALTWMIVLGTPTQVLAVHLGASTLQIGLIHSFVYLMLPVQILATLALPRYGYRRVVVFGWGTRAFFALIPLALVLAAPTQPAPWMVLAVVLAIGCFTFFRSVGASGFNTWQFALLPETVRGRYFATEQLVSGVAGILILLVCASLFDYLPLYQAFAWQYGIALVGSALAVANLMAMPDVPKPTSTSLRQLMAALPRLTLGQGPYRQYLLFAAGYHLVATSISPFVTYYLQRERSLPLEELLTYAAIQYIGVVGSSYFLRSRIDRWGTRLTFRVGFALQIAVAVYWLLVLSTDLPLLVGLPLNYILVGMVGTYWLSAHMKYLPQVAPGNETAIAISVHAAVVGMVAGLAPVLWGALLKDGAPEPGIHLPWFQAFFAAVIVMQIVLILASRHLLPSPGEQPPLLVGGVLFRPLRVLGNLINLTTPGKARSEDSPEA